MAEPIRFRPHHFLCTLGFEGKGYSPEFVAGYARIAERLRAPGTGDAEVIEVEADTDSICEPCPNRRGRACETEDKIRSLDGAHARVLDLTPGDQLTWGQARARIRERVTSATMDEICAPCSWLPAGMCRSALARLRSPGAKTIAALAALLLGIPGLTASAGAMPAPAALPSRPARIAPMDQLEAELRPPKKGPGAELRRLREAETALAAGSWDAALRATAHPASAAAAREEYREVRESYQAQALLGKAKRAATARSWAAAATGAEKARTLVSRLAIENPYSAWMREHQLLLAEAELELGRAEMGRAPRKGGAAVVARARAWLETAFQRLVGHRGIARVEPGHLAAYGQACARELTELCRAWSARFLTTYPKDSVELRALEAALPPGEIEKPGRNPSPSRTSQPYRTPDADQVVLDAALVGLRDGRPKDAVTEFRRLLAEFPRSVHRQRARFWIARLGDGPEEERKSLYETVHRESPFSFHGVLSAYALGRPIDATIDATFPMAADSDRALSVAERVRFERGRVLLAAGAVRAARVELAEVRPREGLSTEFLLYLALVQGEAGATEASFSSLTELLARGAPGALSSLGARLIFPDRIWSRVKAQAAPYPDALLTLSLIKQESAFETEAESGAGALGLMQLMPATAVEVEQGIERTRLLRLDDNVRVGSGYLRKMLDRYSGNAIIALAAYNAGPTAADRWLREIGFRWGEQTAPVSELSALRFIELIPYKETRDYVSSILRNYVWYSRRLTGEAPAGLDLFWRGFVPAPVVPSSPAAGEASRAKPPGKRVAARAVAAPHTPR